MKLLESMTASLVGAVVFFGSARADCGDLWIITETVATLCVAYNTEELSGEREIALRMIAQGDWSWDRLENSDGCALRIEGAGRLDGSNHHYSYQCRIESPEEYQSCVTAALHSQEEALCHLRHVRR